MKILIAEDDRVARLLLNVTLKKLGYEVVEAEDGEQAWQIFHQQTIRMLISDWMMPKINGLRLSYGIRELKRPYYTYIILLTSLDGKQNYLQGMEAGVDDFIVKPFDVETLHTRLRVARRVLDLQAEVKELRGMLPTCFYCRRVRDDRNRWIPMEEYIASRSGATFSHGVCPDCYVKHIQPLKDQNNRDELNQP